LHNARLGCRIRRLARLHDEGSDARQHDDAAAGAPCGHGPAELPQGAEGGEQVHLDDGSQCLVVHVDHSPPHVYGRGDDDDVGGLVRQHAHGARIGQVDGDRAGDSPGFGDGVRRAEGSCGIAVGTHDGGAERAQGERACLSDAASGADHDRRAFF
jgi:hypothetical protein